MLQELLKAHRAGAGTVTAATGSAVAEATEGAGAAVDAVAMAEVDSEAEAAEGTAAAKTTLLAFLREEAWVPLEQRLVLRLAALWGGPWELSERGWA